MKKLNIKLIHWVHNCSDGCCTDYGTDTIINGEKMPLINEDSATILQMVLEHLGYEVEISEEHEGD